MSNEISQERIAEIKAGIEGKFDQLQREQLIRYVDWLFADAMSDGWKQEHDAWKLWFDGGGKQLLDAVTNPPPKPFETVIVGDEQHCRCVICAPRTSVVSPKQHHLPINQLLLLISEGRTADAVALIDDIGMSASPALVAQMAERLRREVRS